MLISLIHLNLLSIKKDFKASESENSLKNEDNKKNSDKCENYSGTDERVNDEKDDMMIIGSDNELGEATAIEHTKWYQINQLIIIMMLIFLA